MRGYSPDHVEALVALERARADLAAIHRQALADAELVEAMRLRAWLRYDRRHVRLGEGDTILMPDGWPEGVDGEAYVLRQLEASSRRAALLVELTTLES